jgi:hypothetical protein
MVVIKFLIRMHFSAFMRSNYCDNVQHAEIVEKVGCSNYWLLSAKKTHLSYKLGKLLKIHNFNAAGIFSCMVRSVRIHPDETLLRK